MDRAHDLLPIVVDRHDMPPPLDGDVVRRRGRGYRRVTLALPPPSEGTNRVARRRAAKTAARAGRVAPLAALLLAPVALAVAPAAAAIATTTTTSTTTTVPDGSTTTTTTGGSTTTSSTATTTTTTTVDPPTTTTTAAGPPPATTVAPTSTTVRTGTTTSPTAPPVGTTATPRTDVPTSTTPLSGTVAPSTTTSSSTSTTVPAAVVAPPVGTVELPPATPEGADPVAISASQALSMHQDLVKATRDLTQVTERRAAADAEAARLEARTSELTAHAFDLMRAGEATAEVELVRSAAQVDLDAARATGASLALREASAMTALDDLSARYPTVRLVLATLVARAANADTTKLDAAWAAAPDARMAVVYAALAQVGDPYVWAASGPNEFDCSGLTAFAWKAAGIVLPHYTVLQRQVSLDATEATLRPGDLVFNLDGPNGGHVQLYLGVGKLVVHAPSPGHNVNVSEYRVTTGFGSPMDDSRTLGDAAATVAADAPHA